MDYSRIIEELKQASLFDLYRLRVAISHQLENPQCIQEIRSRLKLGQTITFFDGVENRLIEAKVIKLILYWHRRAAYETQKSSS